MVALWRWRGVFAALMRERRLFHGEGNRPPMSTPMLPAFAISREAYRILFRNFGAYLRLSWLPFLLILIVSIGIQSYERDLAGLGEHADTGASALGGFALTVIWLLAIPVSTAWTRNILVSAEEPPRFVVGHAEGVYLFRYVCLFLLMILLLALLMIPPGLVAYLANLIFGDGEIRIWPDLPFGLGFTGFVLAGAIALLLSTRFILALPAAAVGNPSRLRDAFAATKGQMWALFAICLLTSAPAVLMWIVDGIWGAEDLADTGVLQALWFTVVDHAVAWLVLPIGDAGLALAYMHLGGMSDGPTELTAPPA